MDVKAAVSYEAGKPLVIETVQLEGPRALEVLVENARATSGDLSDIFAMLRDRRHRRAVPHKLDRAGYAPVRNPDAEDGHWRIAGKRQAVYAIRSLSNAEQIRAARALAARPWTA